MQPSLDEGGDGRGSRNTVYVGDADRGAAIAERLSGSTVTVERRAAALDRLSTDPVDCVVAESDPSSGRGADLLAAVGDRHPEVVRVLVGDSVAAAPPDVAFVSARPADGLAARVARRVERALDRSIREAELADRREQLAELDRINEVIRGVDQLLVEAETRAEIARGVCDRLVESDHYRFACMDPRAAPGADVRPSAWAGVEDGYLADTFDAGVNADGPADAALRTGEAQVVDRIRDDPDFAPWRDPALERGFRSMIAVPLRYREAVYGVLCVYAGCPEAFDPRERTALAELGGTIGHAINAVESKRALVSDDRIEVEFDIYHGEGFFARIAREEDATFDLEGVTMTGEGSFVYFMTVSGVAPGTVLDRTDDAHDVERARLVNEHDDGRLFEFVYTGPSPVEGLAEHGGRLLDAQFTPDGGHSVVELPRSANVRGVVESIRDAIPGTEIVAHRERERPGRTVEEYRTTLDDDLTARQRSALEAAYYAGFFEWPRESTGEEVADSLGVSAPTFHQHLRVGERKLLAAFLDD